MEEIATFVKTSLPVHDEVISSLQIETDVIFTTLNKFPNQDTLQIQVMSNSLMNK